MQCLNYYKAPNIYRNVVFTQIQKKNNRDQYYYPHLIHPVSNAYVTRIRDQDHSFTYLYTIQTKCKNEYNISTISVHIDPFASFVSILAYTYSDFSFISVPFLIARASPWTTFAFYLSCIFLGCMTHMNSTRVSPGQN